jgi:class 3 adenylate cyclase
LQFSKYVPSSFQVISLLLAVQPPILLSRRLRVNPAAAVHALAAAHAVAPVDHAGDYSGATVNVASGVTSEAAAGETLMTESVAEQLRDANAIESVGARTLRGVERPVPLFRLLRE